VKLYFTLSSESQTVLCAFSIESNTTLLHSSPQKTQENPQKQTQYIAQKALFLVKNIPNKSYPVILQSSSYC